MEVNLKMALWLYTRVTGAIITYRSVVWWSTTQQVGVKRLLNGQGKHGTTPTSAMEVLLNLTPLHIHCIYTTYTHIKRSTVIKKQGMIHMYVKPDTESNMHYTHSWENTTFA